MLPPRDISKVRTLRDPSDAQLNNSLPMDSSILENCGAAHRLPTKEIQLRSSHSYLIIVMTIQSSVTASSSSNPALRMMAVGAMNSDLADAYALAA